MLTLIPETGQSLTTANTYVTLAEGNAYAEAHLYASAWVDAVESKRKAALAMATRVIDQEVQFNGFKVSQEQALQWPRRGCTDPDSDLISSFTVTSQSGPYVREDIVPLPIKRAACELAIQLLKGDRTGDAQGQGLRSVEIAGAMKIEFDSQNLVKILPRDVLNMLWKYGHPISSKGGTSKLVRA